MILAAWQCGVCLCLFLARTLMCEFLWMLFKGNASNLHHNLCTNCSVQFLVKQASVTGWQVG